MAAAVTPEFIAGLPKAELHLHLEGTLEPDLKLKLAERNGIDIGQSTIEEIRATYEFDSLTSFLNIYYPAMQVLQTEQDFYDLAVAYFERAKADGVRRAEVFFDPQAHTSRGVPLEAVILGYSRAAMDAAKIGVDADLILCFLRDMPVESALETLEEALDYQEHFVGVGLDSDERGNPPEKFAEVFAMAKQNDLRVTMHCDVDQDGSIDNISTALTQLGTERLDHGTNIVEDEELVQLVAARGIGLTCCPISNSFCTKDSKVGEIVELLRRGVKVTINSDDPAYFGGYVADNYLALAQAADLSAQDLAQLARNSFDVAWIDDEDRQQYLAEIDAYMAANG